MPFDIDAVTKVAETIANCDFRTAISRYTSTGGREGSWVIAVGEFDWHRYLVIEKIDDEGGDTHLELLSRGECYKPITNLDLSHVERRFTLKELTSGSYVDVKRALGMPVNGA